MISEQDFRFCQACGAHFVESGGVLVCQKCDLHYYINPKPTNAVILINSRHEILLTRRAHNPQKGKWDLPGGFVAVGETIEESINREVMEELGIQVKNCVYLCSEWDEYPFKGIVYKTICTIFTAEFDQSQQIVPADDVSEVKFVTPSMVDPATISFGGVVRAIETYTKTMRS